MRDEHLLQTCELYYSNKKKLEFALTYAGGNSQMILDGNTKVLLFLKTLAQNGIRLDVENIQ